MIVCGIDIGSVATKSVILKDERILARGLCPTGAEPKLAAEEALNKTLKQLSLS